MYWLPGGLPLQHQQGVRSLMLKINAKRKPAHVVDCELFCVYVQAALALTDIDIQVRILGAIMFVEPVEILQVMSLPAIFAVATKPLVPW